jgi:UDP-N-acetylglucosamine--N-acetylmuramyl-(pentapeptide) pyrophosphoryl-undecaprenol N-acetylglucosamine transferase
VNGVGGYASGPVVLMARLRGIPTAICEQNSIPGLTNKILGRVVRRVFVAFAESARFFNPKKIALAGNPVRRGLLEAFAGSAPTENPEPRIFVCGGSLGATKVNEIASLALISLAKQRKFHVVHQTGAADVDKIRARYEAEGVSAQVDAFIDQMAQQYLQADVIVSRAGATTVAELAIAGKPAIFVPYPFAADNHQEINAREMADAGAALMFRQADLTPAILAQTLEELLGDPDRRAKMGSVMKSLARPGAAATVVDWCLEATKR